MNRMRLFSTLIGVAAITAVVSIALANTGEKPVKKKLTGEDLYKLNCNRCHAERYATELTDAQWKTIMLHMRTRAQIPADDAKAILKYLQENN
jgi:mono/diheme cytochrome c family protein